MRRSLAAATTTALLLALGCTPGGEPAPLSREWQLTYSGAATTAGRGQGSSSMILEGARLCPTIACDDRCLQQWEDKLEEFESEYGHPCQVCPEEADDVADCFVQGAEGAGTLDEEGCLTLEGSGTLAWTFAAQPCPLNALGWLPVDDAFSFESAAATDVRAVPDWWIEELLLQDTPALSVVVDPDDLAARWMREEGETLFLLDGTTIPLELRSPEDEKVRWTREWSFEGTASQRESGSGLEVTLGPHRFEVADVVAVERTRATSLEVLVVYAADSSDGEVRNGTPLGLRALLRDDAGEPVFGAPVQWRLRSGSPLAMTTMEAAFSGTEAPPGVLTTSGWVFVSDSCETLNELSRLWRRTTVEASFDGLVATRELAWSMPESAVGERDDEWQPPAACHQPEGACACSAVRTTRAHSWPGLGALFTLLALLRRGRTARLRPRATWRAPQA